MASVRDTFASFVSALLPPARTHGSLGSCAVTSPGVTYDMEYEAVCHDQFDIFQQELGSGISYLVFYRRQR
jgi:hypothetical protein